MSITDTFSRSWEITKKSFAVIKADKEILAFPILASVFSIIFFLIMAVPFLLTGVMQALGLDKLGSLLYYILIFVLYLGVSFISTFFNVAVVYCAKKRFEGKDPTFSEGLHEAIKRIHLILLWSLVSATVGLVLRILEDSVRRSKSDIGRILGSIVIGLLGAAWSIVSLFVIPAIVFDNVGPFEALKISVKTIKKTWGESLVRHYGLGLAELVFVIAGIILLGIPAFLLLGVFWPASLLLIGLLVIYLMVVFLLFSTANTIFNTALFMYASKGKVPNVYSHEVMKGAFASTKKII